MWVTAELNGYRDIRDVPAYRKISAPIMQVVDSPYLGRSTQLLNVLSLPEPIREHITETVPLNQGVDELEAMASLHEAQNRLVELGVFAGDAYAAVWNRNPRRAFNVVALYWAVSPASLRGVLGRIRTALTEFVIELLTEVGGTDQLPSAEQVDRALQATVFNNSTVNFFMPNGQMGDVVTNQPHTVIKGNKTTIKDSKATSRPLARRLLR